MNNQILDGYCSIYKKVFAESDLKAALIKYNGQKANVGRGRKVVPNRETLVLKTKNYTAKLRLGMNLL